MDKKILDIQPFNEIFYKTCEYNPLLSAVYYLGRSVLPFLGNDFFTYSYKSDRGFRLEINNIRVKPEVELLFDMGISVNSIDNIDDGIREIKLAIQNNSPVYVPIDRYYWSDKAVNSGIYNTTHAVHFFLIIGYNDMDHKFKIIDVSETQTIINDIDYYELIDCYKGFLKNNNGKAWNLFSLSLLKDSKKGVSDDRNMIIKQYKENYAASKEQLFTGLENIKAAVNFYRSTEDNPALLTNDNYMDIALPIDFIERAKKVEAYRIYTFFGQNQLIIDIIKQILKDFNVVKSVLLKIAMRKSFSDNYLLTITEKLNNLYNLELDYYSNLEQLLELY